MHLLQYRVLIGPLGAHSSCLVGEGTGVFREALNHLEDIPGWILLAPRIGT